MPEITPKKENFDKKAKIKCKKCGKVFDGYKGQKALCIKCFDKWLNKEK